MYDRGETRVGLFRVVAVECCRNCGRKRTHPRTRDAFSEAPIASRFSIAKCSNPTSPNHPHPRPSTPQVKKFAQKQMKTSDVRVDVKLNKAIWSKGIRNVRILPKRVPYPREASIRLLGFSSGHKLTIASHFPPINRFPAAFASKSPAAATTTRTPRRTFTPTSPSRPNKTSPASAPKLSTTCERR